MVNEHNAPQKRESWAKIESSLTPEEVADNFRQVQEELNTENAIQKSTFESMLNANKITQVQFDNGSIQVGNGYETKMKALLATRDGKGIHYADYQVLRQYLLDMRAIYEQKYDEIQGDTLEDFADKNTDIDSDESSFRLNVQTKWRGFDMMRIRLERINPIWTALEKAKEIARKIKKEK